MSGDLVPLPEAVQLKADFPGLLLYLDDAHGLGVMGPKGQGTAAHFGLTARADFIMGTFSKALASIGGFIASDDEETLKYLRHHSGTLIFSAALPASNAATVLACLKVIEREPERVDRLREITRRVRTAYQEIGLLTNGSPTPIIPIFIGAEEKAAVFAQDLFEQGVFALPAVFPAVPRGQALIRTAFMSTHTDSQINFVLEVLANLARKHRVLAADLSN
jgi:glycine C-acetyltransferase